MLQFSTEMWSKSEGCANKWHNIILSFIASFQAQQIEFDFILTKLLDQEHMMSVNRKYYSSWIAAAERGDINWETASMLIEAFELGIAECVEALTTTNKSAPQIAEEAIQIKNDTNQYLKNIGKEVSYPPSGLHHKLRIDEIENELISTINFGSRRLHCALIKSKNNDK